VTATPFVGGRAGEIPVPRSRWRGTCAGRGRRPAAPSLRDTNRIPASRASTRPTRARAECVRALALDSDGHASRPRRRSGHAAVVSREGAAGTVVESSRACCRGANLGGCGRWGGTTSRVAPRGVPLVSFCRGRRAGFAARRAARRPSRVPAESRRRRKWASGSASCPPRSRGKHALAPSPYACVVRLMQTGSRCR
jgi:hypothetical protein